MKLLFEKLIFIILIVMKRLCYILVLRSEYEKLFNGIGLVCILFAILAIALDTSVIAEPVNINKADAKTISKNLEFIFTAVFSSTIPLKTTIPPNADTGSPAKALSYAFPIELPRAVPHGFRCLTITQARLSKFLFNSAVKLAAA